MAGHTFNLALLSEVPNILGEDTKEIVQYQQDLTHFYYFDPTHRQETNVYFMESTINIKDNIYDIFDATEKDLSVYEIEDSQTQLSWIPPSTAVADRIYVKVFFRQASEAHFFKREDYDMLTYFGDLGGLLDFVVWVGWTISTVFVSRLFAADLVSRAYRVQKYLLDIRPFYHTSKQDGHLTTESDSVDSNQDKNENGFGPTEHDDEEDKSDDNIKS